jgi:ABC-type transport system involved in multi-copper enzyme maturation permease subunit
MNTKELLESRWKVITFAVLAVLVCAANIGAYKVGQLAPSGYGFSALQVVLQEHPSFNTFVWSSWFQVNGLFILGLLAILLGSGLIAGEVSKGTIFFLLSKPVNRERILLTKYGVSAGLLLAVSVLSSVVVAVTCALLGQPQNVLSLLVATVLLWLATLFPLGVALCFSLIAPDSLRAVIFAALVVLVLALLPLSLASGPNPSLGAFWSSQHAYLAGSFPVVEYVICLLTAVIPLAVALVVFRRKAY